MAYTKKKTATPKKRATTKVAHRTPNALRKGIKKAIKKS